MSHGREKGVSCQRKTPGDKVGGTRIPLPIVSHRPLVERTIKSPTIAEDTPFHPACSKKQLDNQNYVAETLMAGTRSIPLSSTVQILSNKDEDLDSLCSYGSVGTTMSCDHAYFARNGTTFSGRCRKYIVHCSSYNRETAYLTPTQRANKQIHGLKMLLSEAKRELQKKDQDIHRLMKELMELRLYKAALLGSEKVPGVCEDLNSAQAANAEHKDTLGDQTNKAVCANNESIFEELPDSAYRQENVQTSPAVVHIGKIAVDFPSSLTDSGNFEETASSSPSILLSEGKKHLEKKDLNKEVMELHLYKAPLSSHEQIEDSTDKVNSAQDTNSEQKYSLIKEETFQGVCANSECCEHKHDCAPNQENVQTSPGLIKSRKTAIDLPSSLTDSGHFEETASSSANLKDSRSIQQIIKDHASSDVLGDRGEGTSVHMWEKKLDELQRRYVNECEEHNDRVQKLLQNLSDAKERYYELRSDYEQAQDKIRELEKEAESLRKELGVEEEKHKSMYLKMYIKGQEAARFEHADQMLEFANAAPTQVCVPELLKQLQITENELEKMKENDKLQSECTETALLTAKEAITLWILGTRKAMYRKIVESRTGKNEIDPVITLQFLKSAIYHFLTDKENYQGHLHAIGNILGYSENEKLNIQKAYRSHAKK